MFQEVPGSELGLKEREKERLQCQFDASCCLSDAVAEEGGEQKIPHVKK